MRGSAVAAAAAHTLGLRHQALDLAQLALELLQLGGLAGEHVDPEVIADGHLVGEAPRSQVRSATSSASRRRSSRRRRTSSLWGGASEPVGAADLVIVGRRIS